MGATPMQWRLKRHYWCLLQLCPQNIIRALLNFDEIFFPINTNDDFQSYFKTSRFAGGWFLISCRADRSGMSGYNCKYQHCIIIWTTLPSIPASFQFYHFNFIISNQNCELLESVWYSQENFLPPYLARCFKQTMYM